MNIVVAVDGSRHSRAAVEFLLKLPLRTSPRILVVDVVDFMALTHPLIAPRLQVQYGKLMRMEIKRSRMTAYRNTIYAAERLRTLWRHVVPVVAEGHAAERIITLSDKFKADLIVLGSRGLGEVQKFLLGSVSSTVAAKSRCSVLVVKKNPRRIKKLLLAIDGSGDSRLLARFASEHFLRSGLTGILLNVWDYPFRRPGLTAPIIEAKFGRPLARAGIRLRAVSVAGRAAEKIVQTAAAKRTDLVMVGSRGFTRIKEIILGGVSSKVVRHAPCSVLVVKKRLR